MTRWTGPDDDVRSVPPVVALLLVLAVVAATVGALVYVRWTVDRNRVPVRSVTGTWCGSAAEAMTVVLSEVATDATDASEGRVLVPTGELTGWLELGGRTADLTGRVGPRGAVRLETVGSTLSFLLEGALVEDRLRLAVTDDAGDIGRVELERC